MEGSAYHGWKFGLPDKFWPVTLDNFFDNPDEIRELGLRMVKGDESVLSSLDKGRWPGIRSETLWKVDKELAHKITERVLSCYFNFNYEQIFWNYCDMRFQLISRFDKDKNNLKNKGWIHIDATHPHQPQPDPEKNQTDKFQLAGLIYLTPDIETYTGTSLFIAKKDKTLHDWRKNIDVRKTLFKGDPISDEEIKEAWEKHRSCFIEKVMFNNIYNRLVMYDGKEFHAANSYYTSKDARLTLGFFIGGILAPQWPLERVRKI